MFAAHTTAASSSSSAYVIGSVEPRVPLRAIRTPAGSAPPIHGIDRAAA